MKAFAAFGSDAVEAVATSNASNSMLCLAGGSVTELSLSSMTPLSSQKLEINNSTDKSACKRLAVGSQGGLLVVSNGSKIHLYKRRADGKSSFKLSSTLAGAGKAGGEEEEIVDLSLNKASSLLVSTSHKAIRVWDLSSHTCLAQASCDDFMTDMEGNAVELAACRFCDEGQSVCSAINTPTGGLVLLHSLKGKALAVERRVKVTGGRVTSLDVTANFLVVGTDKGDMLQLSCDRLRVLRRASHHVMPVTGLKALAHGDVMSVGFDNLAALVEFSCNSVPLLGDRWKKLAHRGQQIMSAATDWFDMLIELGSRRGRVMGRSLLSSAQNFQVPSVQVTELVEAMKEKVMNSFSRKVETPHL